MGVSEVRTQIYLPREQHRELKRTAERRSVSMAQLIREALAEFLSHEPGRGKGGESERPDPVTRFFAAVEEIGGSEEGADASRSKEELYGPVER